jgi:hypothetical protein
MEAKDTVMSTDKIGKLGRVEYDSNCLMVMRGLNIKTVVEEQAEISFKAGYHQREIDPLDKEDRCEKCYEQGIKEVVEWLEANFEPTVPMSLDYRKWQTKLKEWGME